MTCIPNCLWAQKKENLIITVDVSDYTDLNVNIAPQSLDISWKVNDKNMKLNLPLFALIDIDKSKYKAARGVVFYLTKVKNERWPTLLPPGDKRTYIKNDWSRWVDSDDEDEDGGIDGFDKDGFNFDKFDMSQFAGMEGMGGEDTLNDEENDDDLDDEIEDISDEKNEGNFVKTGACCGKEAQCCQENSCKCYENGSCSCEKKDAQCCDKDSSECCEINSKCCENSCNKEISAEYCAKKTGLSDSCINPSCSTTSDCCKESHCDSKQKCCA